MDTVKVLQIVGFKNSGKTTLMSRLLGLAQESGKRVSTIKHHGHGGVPEMPPATTDSARFFEEGAASSIVYGDGVVQLHQRLEEASLDDLLGMAKRAQPDLVLVEGFKKADWDKIVLIRSEEDWGKLERLKGIRLVVVPEDLRIVGVETIARDDQQLEKWFLEWMEGETNESI